MGVVHKLKEDVVLFLESYKANHSAISVRRLAALTSEKFRINVSKSSVNAVLKNALLSSSVGRRPTDSVRTERFSIPSAKKDEISKSISKAGLFDAPETSKSPSQRRTKATKISQEPSFSSEKINAARKPLTSSEAQTDKESEWTLEQPIADKEFLNSIEKIRRDRGQRETAVMEGMGFIFLKAAQWEISGRSLAGELLWGCPDLRGSVEHSDAASDMFLFLKVLGVDGLDQALAYRSHGLWLLNGLESLVGHSETMAPRLWELFQRYDLMGVEQSSKMLMEYGFKKDQAFLEVHGFKVVLEDGSEIFVGACLAPFGRDEGSPTKVSGGTRPLCGAVAELSRCLVSNARSLIFYKIPGDTEFNRDFLDMIGALENLPKKRILKVGVMDVSGRCIAEFLSIPKKRRFFSAGVSPQHMGFEDITKAAKWAAKKPFFHPGSNRAVYFAETQTSVLSEHVQGAPDRAKVITLWENRDSGPCWAILANRTDAGAAAILQEYMSRWPYFGRFAAQSAVPVTDGPRLSEKRPFFMDFAEALHDYCRRHYFPQALAGIDLTAAMADIYGMPGTLCQTQDDITVTLRAQAGCAFHDDLKRAAQNVNTRHIFDRAGRKMWIAI